MVWFHIPRGRDFWSWPPTIVALLVLLVFSGLSTSRVLRREWRLRTERKALEQEIRELRSERQAREARIQELMTPGGVERLAKETLGLKREGEEVAIVVPEEQATTTRAEPPGPWKRIWTYFLGFLFR